MALSVLLFALIFAVICDVIDVRLTVRGIKAGVGVEGNEFITTLARTNKPTAIQLLGIDLSVLGLIAGAAFVLPTVLIPGLAVSLCVAGVKHIQGARQWAYLLANPGKSLPVAHTIWQKIVGIWI